MTTQEKTMKMTTATTTHVTIDGELSSVVGVVGGSSEARLRSLIRIPTSCTEPHGWLYEADPDSPTITPASAGERFGNNGSMSKEIFSFVNNDRADVQRTSCRPYMPSVLFRHYFILFFAYTIYLREHYYHLSCTLVIGVQF